MAHSTMFAFTAIFALFSIVNASTYYFKFEGTSGVGQKNPLIPLQTSYFTGICDAIPFQYYEAGRNKFGTPIKEITLQLEKEKGGDMAVRVSAVLLNLFVIGLVIASVVVPPAAAAAGAAATIIGVILGLTPEGQALVGKFKEKVTGKQRKGDNVEVAISKITAQFNTRLNQFYEYVDSQNIQYEKEIIYREFKHMFYMYLGCSIELEPDKAADFKLPIFQQCLLSAHRYINSGYFKFSLFYETLRTGKADEHDKKLNSIQAKRLESNLATFSLYYSLLHDLTRDLPGIYTAAKEHFETVGDENYDKTVEYLDLVKKELLAHHSTGNLERCQLTLRCDTVGEANEVTDFKCSCIIDPLMSGEKARCFVKVKATTKKMSEKDAMTKLGDTVVLTADGNFPKEVVENYLRNKNNNGLVEVANAYSGKLTKAFDKFWLKNIGYLMEKLSKK